jgi:hypothetical protein
MHITDRSPHSVISICRENRKFSTFGGGLSGLVSYIAGQLNPLKRRLSTGGAPPLSPVGKWDARAH